MWCATRLYSGPIVICIIRKWYCQCFKAVISDIVFLSGKNIDRMIEIMNGELNKVFLWLNYNKLSLNVKNPQFMVFSLKKHIIANTEMWINNQIIDCVEHTTFLGVILDSHLTYHIQHVKIQIVKNIGILCRARKVLRTTTLITLYYAFIYPYLTYCVEVWGSAAKVYITSVVKIQKLACRIITSMPPRTSSVYLFTMLNFLNFNAIYMQCVLVMIWKSHSPYTSLVVPGSRQILRR